MEMLAHVHRAVWTRVFLVPCFVKWEASRESMGPGYQQVQH